MILRRLPWRTTLLTLASWVVCSPADAQVGNFCVRDFQAGAVCTANDVRVQALFLRGISETCAGGVPGSAVADFELFVSAAGAPDRYDIGLFVALGGASARDGDSCFHDYLAPPLTPTPAYGDRNGDGIPDIAGGPWLEADGDACGDIAAGTQLFTLTPTLRVACVDTNNDGFVDASVCTSWDNNAGSVCSGLTDAFPGTNAKCGCVRLETGIPMPPPTPPPSPSPSPFPSGSPGPTPSPGPSPVPGLPPVALAALAALLAGGGHFLLRRGRSDKP